MTEQYYPVILEINSRIVRAGFAGDAAPISTVLIDDSLFNFDVPTANQRKLKALESQSTTGAKKNLLMFPYNTILGCMESGHDQVSHFYTVDLLTKKWLFNNDIILDQELESPGSRTTENLLEKVVARIYHDDLLVDAKRCKVIVPSSVLWPFHVKKAIANVLLNDIHAQSLIFLPDAILSVLAAGSSQGIVVDFSWDHVSISPVYDQKLLYKNIKLTTRGSGKKLHYDTLTTLLQQTEGQSNSEILQNKETAFLIVEDIINNTFYCHSTKDTFDENDAAVFDYTSPQGIHLKIPQESRHSVLYKSVFQQPEHADIEEMSPFNLLLSLLLELPIDLRPELSRNIIFTGSLSQIPGLKSRFLQELRQLAINDNIASKLTFESIVSLGCWAGASLYCSTKLMASSSAIKSQELIRDKYLQGDSTIPDWIDQIYMANKSYNI